MIAFQNSKHIKKLKLLTLLLVFVSVVCNAQFPFESQNKRYNDQVQTVLLHPVDEPLSQALILADATNALSLSFDVIGDIAYTYNYTLIHCNHQWEPSDLRPNEYIEGYHEDQINDYRFSLNTLTPYIHYKLVFPTSYLKPKLSGNYLLVVYNGELVKENLLFTRRLQVVDPRITLKASVPQHNRDSKYGRTHQQVDVEALIPAYLGNIPANSFFLTIQQNGRTDNIVEGLQPSQTYTDHLVYEYLNETVFEGSNHWRNLDLKSFKYQSERIDRIITGDDYFTVKLWEDQRRNRQVYASDIDIHGKKLIQARQDQDTDIEGDYAWVEFSLPYSAPLTHGEIHILGAANDWDIDATSRMRYNYQMKRYEASLFLKQGYYNYLYGIKETGEKAVLTEEIEGSHWDNQHEYLISLYFRKPGTSYDQLIGTILINSH